MVNARLAAISVPSRILIVVEAKLEYEELDGLQAANMLRVLA